MTKSLCHSQYCGIGVRPEIQTLRSAGRFSARSDLTQLTRRDVIVVCVPMPLSRQREPDLPYVQETTGIIPSNLRSEAFLIWESTTCPRTNDQVVRDIFEQKELKCGSYLLLGFSPERGDLGKNVDTSNTDCAS